MKPLIGILLLITVFGCAKDKGFEDEEDKFVCPYGIDWMELTHDSISGEGLIPLNLKNYWVFADTAWDTDGNVIYTDSLIIKPILVWETDGDIWWTFNQIINTIYQKDDTVYQLEATYPNGCLNKRVEYYALGIDTVITNIIIEGDIGVVKMTYIVNDTIKTPAGNFTQSYHYEYLEWYSVIIKDGIGFINIAYYNIPGNKARELTLIDYHLE